MFGIMSGSFQLIYDGLCNSVFQRIKKRKKNQTARRVYLKDFYQAQLFVVKRAEKRQHRYTSPSPAALLLQQSQNAKEKSEGNFSKYEQRHRE